MDDRETTLELLAEDARKLWAQIDRADERHWEAQAPRWLALGEILNEARARLKSDEQFGQWVEASVNDNLSFTPNLHERAAAMWAAEDRERFEAMRRAPSGSFPAERYTVGLSAGVQPVQKIATG